MSELKRCKSGFVLPFDYIVLTISTITAVLMLNCAGLLLAVASCSLHTQHSGVNLLIQLSATTQMSMFPKKKVGRLTR